MHFAAVQTKDALYPVMCCQLCVVRSEEALQKAKCLPTFENAHVTSFTVVPGGYPFGTYQVSRLNFLKLKMCYVFLSCGCPQPGVFPK